MSQTVLLFVVGHRPLAFLMGQALYLVTPLADLLGFATFNQVAQLLSRPEAIVWLEQALQERCEP